LGGGVVVPLHPAAYVRDVGDWQPLLEAAAQRGWPVPLVYAAGAGTERGRAGVLRRLEAAVRAGRHDGLLMPLSGVLGDAGRLMGVLVSCTRSGVVVSFVPVGDPGRRMRACGGEGWW
jgi:hypothetical protein